VELFGRATQHFDDKNRVVVPRKFRDALGQEALDAGLMITRGFEGCLFVFTTPRWKDTLAEFAAVHYTRKKGRLLKRFFLEGAERGVPDKTGRILVPDHLKEWAKLGDEALFIGVLDRLEIWSPAEWAKLQKQHLGEYEDLAEGFLDYLQGRDSGSGGESDSKAAREAGSSE
jgi:MraZ protein